MSTSLVDAARDYLAAGLPIIALAGKAPNGAIHRHGLNQALRGAPDGPEDEALLERLFTHFGTTGVGIILEAPWAVIDVDGETGARHLLELGVTFDDLVNTPVARSGRAGGGLHVWYRFPEPQRSAKVGNPENRLDIKGIGGYVVAPPSVHPDTGHLYMWLVPLVVDRLLVEPREAPKALVTHLAEERRLDDYLVRVKRQRYATAGSLDPLVRHVGRLEEGNRNRGLYWAACAARDDGIPFEEAAPRLLEAAMSVGLGKAAALATIRSANRQGAR